MGEILHDTCTIWWEIPTCGVVNGSQIVGRVSLFEVILRGCHVKTKAAQYLCAQHFVHHYHHTSPAVVFWAQKPES